MQGRSLLLSVVLVFLLSVLPFSANAQVSGSSTSAQNVSVPQVIRFSGKMPVNGTASRLAGVTFALYREQEGGAPLWVETQNVSADASGAYSVLLGSSTREGVPAELFASTEARWLGVTIEGQPELPRVLLVSVPYALKAGTADTLAGLPAAAFVLNPSFVTTGSGNFANAKAISNGIIAGLSGGGTAGKLPKWLDNAGTLGDSIVSESSGRIGINTTAPVGNLDVFTDGAAGYIALTPFNINLFDKGFLVRASRGNKGSPTATQTNDILFNLYAQAYTGSGYGIAGGIRMQVDAPVSTGLTPGRVSFLTTDKNTGVFTERVRIDSLGNMGVGTTSPTTTLDVAGTIHTTGGVKFNDNSVQTTAALTQTLADGRYLQLTGGTLTGALTGTTFSGSGAGLTNVNAATLGGNLPAAFEFVANKNAASGYAGLDATSRIAKAQAPSTAVFTDQANTFTAGKQDLSAATATLPVQAVLTANAPATCVPSKELLIETDTTPGQQLFICNTTGNGWLLAGDGGSSGTITGVLAGTGLLGGGTSGTVTLSVDSTKVVTGIAAGTGITASGGTGNVTVGLDQTFTDGRYAKLSGGNTLVGTQAVTGAITASSTITASGAISGNSVNSNTKYLLAGNTILSTLGSGNLYVGLGVDPVNTTGHDNTMTGSVAGSANTTGYSNSFYGSLSGYSNIDGYYNVYIGEASGYSHTSGHDNAYLGFVSGYSNSTGIGNTVVGSNAGYYNATGDNNTFVGFVAGAGVNNTGSENVYLGHNAGTAAAAEDNTMRLGDPAIITNTYAAGVFGTTVGGDGIAVMVDSAGHLGTVVSSRRFKENIQPMADLSTGLLRLKPVSFYYKSDVDKSQTRSMQYGLIAEDVAKVYPDLVVYDKEGKPFTVKYQYLTPMLLNELQKQHEVIAAQQQEAESQRDEIKSLQTRLERLEKLLEEKAK